MTQMTHSLATYSTSTLSGSSRRLSGGAFNRALLTSGALAGPVYLSLGLVQAFTRPGFDLTRHDLSLLSNGAFGWVQIGNFVLSGVLVVAGALGMRRTLRSGRGRTWGPILLAGYGLGLIGAGIFVADPAVGFPPGTPAAAASISWHGLMHFATGGTGFLALIAACGVFGRRFAALHQPAWVVYSVLTGAVFLAGFIGIAAGSGDSRTILGFWVAVVLAWSWITALSVRQISELRAE
jgi:Protein of unknown function (DUF998)